MAQLTTTSISIDGKRIEQFNSFSLSQGIYDHHNFRLSCPSNAIDDIAGTMFNQSKNLIGASFTVQTEAVTTSGTLKFKGIITKVEAERYSGSSGDIVISGHSATMLLESGPHCKTWEKKAVKNIAQDVFKHFPQNILNPKIAPLYPETLSYFVQYKETAWRFLTRLCSTFGEWLYFDGQSVILGPPSGPSAQLIFGNNLSRFSLALNVKPASLQVMAYDYINNEVYTSKPNGIESKAGLNDLGKTVFKASQAVYASSPKQWNNHFLTNKKQLDDVVNIQLAMRSAKHVYFNGSSDHPGVAIGGKISVKGQNLYSFASEEFGDYTVISVNHYTDGQGNYSNDFVAIPASIKLPPVASLPEPVSETQSAIVTDNHDPKGLGRIRIKFHWMNGAEKSPWIRVTSPHGGGGKGMHFIPEVGEEVIVGFEGDSPLKPYVIGTVYHGRANSSFSNAGNDVKALQTRSGNKVVMNDADGSVFIEDKDGNSMMQDGKGNITVLSNKTITLVTGKSSIVMDHEGNITVSGKLITMTATEDIVGGAKNIGMAAKEAFVAQAKTTGIIGSNELALQSKALTAQGSVSTSVNGGKVDIGADGNLTVTGALVKINS